MVRETATEAAIEGCALCLARDVARYRAAAIAVRYASDMLVGYSLRNGDSRYGIDQPGPSLAAQLDALADWPSLFASSGRPRGSLRKRTTELMLTPNCSAISKVL